MVYVRSVGLKGWGRDLRTVQREGRRGGRDEPLLCAALDQVDVERRMEESEPLEIQYQNPLPTLSNSSFAILP